MAHLLQDLFAAADAHGDDGEPDYTVGDLWEMVMAFWERSPPHLRLAWLETERIANLCDCLGYETVGERIAAIVRLSRVKGAVCVPDLNEEI